MWNIVKSLFNILLTTLLCHLQEANGHGLWQKSSLFLERNFTRGLVPLLQNSVDASLELRKFDKDLGTCGLGKLEIREITIAKLQKYFERGELSSVEITQCYLDRIEAMDPQLKAVLQINPDAIAIAQSLDLKRANGEVRGSFHGIPILIKDNIATFDQMENTAGSLALIGAKPKTDSKLVALLRKAGAVILGKTNLSEFAYFRSTEIPSGWSGRGGQARSPYALGEDPSGSSTGSATSVAANLCTVSIGSETDGSIIAPSSRGSVVGLKPTVGRVSTHGVIPISFTQDSVGPIARTVQDAATLFKYMIPNQVDTNKGHGHAGSDFDDISISNGKKFTVGVLRDPFWKVADEKTATLEYALEGLKKAGVKVIDPIKAAPGSLDAISGDKEFIVLLHEFKWGLNTYLQDVDTTNAASATLEEVIQYNDDHPVPEGYAQILLQEAQLTDGLENITYLTSRAENLAAAREYISLLMEEYGLDAIATPSLDEEVNSPTFMFSVAAIAGYPIINVPVGIESNTGMPFGLSFTGLPYSEFKLFQISHLLEKEIDGRKSPRFRP